MPDFTDMLSKAKEMQSKMKEAQDAIKNNELPEDVGAIKRVASAMKVALKYGIDVEVAEIVPLVINIPRYHSANILSSNT